MSIPVGPYIYRGCAILQLNAMIKLTGGEEYLWVLLGGRGIVVACCGYPGGLTRTGLLTLLLELEQITLLAQASLNQWSECEFH
jgi:hypothetical protein